MLVLVRKNGKRRFDATAPERTDDVLFGMKVGATLGVGFCCWLAAIRVVSGPGVFERVGLTWEQMAALYFAGFVAAGGAYGALDHRRHHALAAMLQGFLMTLPPMVAVPVNVGLSYGRVPSVPRDLGLALIALLVVGGLLGLWVWREDRRANLPGDGAFGSPEAEPGPSGAR